MAQKVSKCEGAPNHFLQVEMQTSVKLPRITHPSHRRCNTDIESLKLQGNGMISSRGRDNHSAVSGVTRKVKMLENKKTRGDVNNELFC